MSTEPPAAQTGAGDRTAGEPSTVGERVAEAARDVGQRVTEAVQRVVRPSASPSGLTVRDVMTPSPITLPASATLVDAARVMRDADMGSVVVLHEDGSLCGIVTDRDLVIRAIAEDFLPRTMLEAVCTREAVTVGPDDDVTVAEQLMRERAIRRLPVVERGQVVGIVSLGDVAVKRDPQSLLGAISAAPPQR